MPLLRKRSFGPDTCSRFDPDGELATAVGNGIAGDGLGTGQSMIRDQPEPHQPDQAAGMRVSTNSAQ